MGKFVCAGAMLQCSMGAAPTMLNVIDPTSPKVQGKPMANIMDNKPFVNVATFGMCRSLANPTVASATAAALGTLTPMPCIPNLVAPWTPGGQVKVGNLPALLDNCKLVCAWAGNISINNPGNVCNAEGK